MWNLPISWERGSRPLKLSSMNENDISIRMTVSIQANALFGMGVCLIRVLQRTKRRYDSKNSPRTICILEISHDRAFQF
jgi:hypothetical protein